MASPDLLFESAPATGSPVELVYGAIDFVIPSIQVNVSATIQNTVSVSAIAGQPVKAVVFVTLANTMTVAAQAWYDNRVIPIIETRIKSDFQPGTTSRRVLGSDWSLSNPNPGGIFLPHQTGVSAMGKVESRHETSLVRDSSAIAPNALGIQVVAKAASLHETAIFIVLGGGSTYTLADHRSTNNRVMLQTGIFKPTPMLLPWGTGLPARHLFDALMGRAVPEIGINFNTARWQLGTTLLLGKLVPPDVPVVPPLPISRDLLFQFLPLSFPALVFGEVFTQGPTGQSIFAILPARFYMTAHTIYAQTLPGLVDVPIYETTVSADSGSYCWSLQASGPASLFDQLAPVGGLPAQIKITLDGIPWVFAVDSMARTHAFGKTGVRLQGRSITSLIAAPYLRATTRSNATDQTAQQIALDALTSTGVDLDWGVGAGALANGGLVDWLIPATAWSHQGTPLDAVQAVVQAAGGYLQSHRSNATLQARHPYGQRVGDVSGAPWNWSLGAADVELATDALITESVQRQDGPDINAVYVSGTTAGVLAWVKRLGSAGEKLSPMVTDQLITHTDVARQRGLSILGAAGHKYAVSLDLPVLTGAGQPGVLDVGQLVQVNATQPWRARVRSVSVQANQPSLRQTVTLERHLETV